MLLRDINYVIFKDKRFHYYTKQLTKKYYFRVTNIYFSEVLMNFMQKNKNTKPIAFQ